MILFGSDLDRTLIYSKVFTDPLEEKSQDEIQLIETLEGREISFMTKKAMKLLKHLQDRVLFVPVTTRTIDQYKRITFIAQELKPKYAVVSNGGNILLDGEPIPAWQHSMKQQMEDESIPYESIKKMMKSFRGKWILKERCADDFFHYMIVDRDKAPLQEIEAFGEEAKTQGWSVSLQGRKLYFVPTCINKGKALQAIAKWEGKERILAAGDSLLDLPMLDKAHIGLIPTHGEIYETHGEALQMNRPYSFMERKGIYAAEEILERVLLINRKNCIKLITEDS